MNALDTRTILGIGSGVATIYAADNGYIVEVTSNKGTTSIEVAEHDEAYHTFLHPFDRESRMSIPGTVDRTEAMRPLSPAEHALLEAYELAEGGEVDVA
jgi:hypothetical protein